MRVTLFLERASVDGVEATLWGEVSAAVAIRQAERATRGFPVGLPLGTPRRAAASERFRIVARETAARPRRRMPLPSARGTSRTAPFLVPIQ
jgi:hypothetical protein